MDRYKIQDNQYIFPYHHIPYIDSKGNVVCYRLLTWGFKYFCYLLHIIYKVVSLNPKSVLDVGCGDGRLLGLLSEDIELKVGVDLSERSIMFAKAFHPDIDFLTKDAKDVRENFDIVIAMEVWSGDKGRKYHTSVINFLRKNGYVFYLIDNQGELREIKSVDFDKIEGFENFVFKKN